MDNNELLSVAIKIKRQTTSPDILALCFGIERLVQEVRTLSSRPVTEDRRTYMRDYQRRRRAKAKNAAKTV